MRIIPLSRADVHGKSWQKQLAAASLPIDELLAILQLTAQQVNYAADAEHSFPLRVTADYLALMEKGNPDDPLLRQVLPVGNELQQVDGFSRNPVGDLEATTLPGLIHKYPGRVLLVTTPACGIHCRYCFRRHYPYRESSTDSRHLQQALDYVAADKAISEVILSGGDPLSLSDERLFTLIDQLEQISHLRQLRIHSRMPIILPDRLTGALAERLAASRLQTVLVLHANHANEISPAFSNALQSFRPSNLTVLNQSVLLRGVNDNAAVLRLLSEKLFANQILPYYLHMLDPVAGAAHFAVPLQEAVDLHKALRKSLPGYLVPRLIRDSAGTGFKENAY